MNGLPSGTTWSIRPDGWHLLDIDTPACRGQVCELGATVTRWAPAGHSDVLWTSERMSWQRGRQGHAGIPVCAPWFGIGRGVAPLPQTHGFVSGAPWTLADARACGDDVLVRFELRDLAALPGAEFYPADLEFALDITFGAHLTVALTVASPTSDVVVDSALHAYLAVDDIRRARVEGLGGASYMHEPPKPASKTQEGPLTFASATDFVYHSDATCVLDDAQRRIRIDKSGSASTVVWNPWSQGASAMDDFGDDEWTSMVCVETANAFTDAVTIAAGSSHTMSLCLSVEPNYAESYGHLPHRD